MGGGTLVRTAQWTQSTPTFAAQLTANAAQYRCLPHGLEPGRAIPFTRAPRSCIAAELRMKWAGRSQVDRVKCDDLDTLSKRTGRTIESRAIVRFKLSPDPLCSRAESSAGNDPGSDPNGDAAGIGASR